MIKAYIRDEQTKQPRGVALVVRNGNEIRYGYSLLNTKMDKFSKEKGTKIALARANAVKPYLLPSVPEREQLVLEAYLYLQNRAVKYFKDVYLSNIIIFEEDMPDIEVPTPVL